MFTGIITDIGEVVARARRKLETKGADFFVANDVSQAAEADHNAVTLLGPNGFEQAFEPEEKGALARRLWAALLDAKIRSNI